MHQFPVVKKNFYLFIIEILDDDQLLYCTYRYIDYIYMNKKKQRPEF